jgi:hypothetical protein
MKRTIVVKGGVLILLDQYVHDKLQFVHLNFILT